LSQLKAKEIDAVRIVRRNLQRREVKAADVVGMIVRDLLPVISEIVGNEQCSFADRRLEKRIDALRIARGDREADAAYGRCGQSFAQPLPGLAAIGRAPDSRAGTAVIERPRPPAGLPGGREEHLAVAGLHRDVDRAGVIVNVERLTPALAAVERHEHSAIGVRPPCVPQCCNDHVIGVVRIDDDAADLADVRETHGPPGLAGIRRQISACAGKHVVADVRFARTHPDDVGIRGCNGDRADGARLFVLEDRLPVQAAVGGLEYAPATCADVVDERIAGDARDGRYSAAGDRRAEIAEFELPEYVLGLVRVGAGRRREGGRRYTTQGKQHDGRSRRERNTSRHHCLRGRRSTVTHGELHWTADATDEKARTQPSKRRTNVSSHAGDAWSQWSCCTHEKAGESLRSHRPVWYRRSVRPSQLAALSDSSLTPPDSSASGMPPPTSMKLRRSTPSVFLRREACAAKPVPAGMSRPTMTFSLRPRRSSLRPRTAASVRTRVVSWNEAAEMNDSVARDALVMPSNTGCRAADCLPSCCARSLMSSARARSSCSPRRRVVSPAACTSVLRSIWRMITSMCLSLIFKIGRAHV